jgi:hypothetical protein
MAVFEDPLLAQIADFLVGIGIPVRHCVLDGPSFLPGLTVSQGRLLVDPERLEWPSDLLHEAGHIAVTAPEDRPMLTVVSDDPGEEMAAIAWSYAAAVEIGLDARVLFHDGYKGGGASLAENFTAGRNVGVPMLQWFGMTQDARTAGAEGVAPYPHMQRWLR